MASPKIDVVNQNMKGQVGGGKAPSKRKHVRELYYITHIDNVSSVMAKGILSHDRIEKENIKYTPIYDEEIVGWRREKYVKGRSLWSFANLYFNARNAMLYRLMCQKSIDDIAVLGISPSILEQSGVIITTGNAACAQTEFLIYSPTMASVILEEANKEYWKEEDGTKRKTMAECLIPDTVPPEYINSIYAPSHETREKVEKSLSAYSRNIPVIPQPYIFFQPYMKTDLTANLSIVDGDMFFSRLQTITVSVNCIGVMGKGVASRVRYQFPDVYVHYQDLCRKHQLKMGQPYLYKRESCTDYQLADEPRTLSEANTETWFLLFPTKRHWRDRADIKGIEAGLKWLRENYEMKKIKSLAIPALGCGLGRLDWREVGPLLYKYLCTLSIPVCIYLPAERKIPKELLSKKFLSEQTKSNRLLDSLK